MEAEVGERLVEKRENQFLGRSQSNLRRDATRFRGFRRLQNGDVVATRQIAPCRRVARDVNEAVLFAKHMNIHDGGTVVSDIDERAFTIERLLLRIKGGGGYALMAKISVNKMALNRVIHCRRTFDVDAQIRNAKRLKDLGCEKKRTLFFSGV